MPIIIKGKTFTATEQVTSTKLHQLVDSATFDPAAADGVTLEVSAGALRVKDLGVTGAKLSATVAIPTAATAVTQAADTNTTAVATCAFAKAEADAGEAAAKAFAIQRANHTGTQAVGTITGLGSLGTATQYESAGVAVPSVGAVATLSHSLSGTPKLWNVVLKCTTSEHSYSINDEVLISNNYHSSSGSVTCWINATTINFVAAAAQPVIISRTTGNPVSITLANWNLVFRAWA